MLRCFFCLLLLLTTVNARSAQHCDPWVAKMASVQGRVDVQYFGTSEWQKINTEDTLCSGDKVRTGKLSRSTITLPNHSVLTLDQTTTLIISGQKPKQLGWLMRLVQGLVFFRSREKQELNIETPFVNAVHEGTEFSVAVDEQRAAITVFDGSVTAQNAQNQLKLTQGQIGIAEKDLRLHLQALKISPTDAVQWSLYYPPLINIPTATASNTPALAPAFAAYQQGDSNKAFAHLAQLPASAHNAEYLRFKAGLLLSVGRVDAAEQEIQTLEQLDASSAKALAAIIALTKNQTVQALQLAREASSNPKSAIAQAALSYAYQAVFDLDSALQAAQQNIVLEPDNALAFARLAELQLANNDIAPALVSAHRAQTLNPQIAKTHTVLGFAELIQTNTAKAQTAFTQAMQLDSADPLAHLGSALVKMRIGERLAGMQALETAVNLDPSNPLIRSYLGKAHYELKNTRFAAKEFALAKALDTKDPTPWFYDAILKQTDNSPVEALQDMQTAIALNDNRAIFRSKLLLDKDVAVREVGLGRIYSNLGFDQVAHRQAIKSLAIDPNNYSAHRLLSDSYANQPRAEISRASELLQAQLLQPLNFNPIQPRLAYSDLNIIRGIGPAETSFNEYNRLFEGNGVRLNTTGIYGAFNTAGDETVLSGVQDKLAYSLGQLHYQSNGFRENNHLRHDLYNVFTQYELSPAFSMQAEYRHRDTGHGDLELNSNTEDLDPLYRRTLRQDTYRAGFKITPSKNSDILVSLIHANRREKSQQSFSAHQYLANNDFAVKSYNFESQYLFHNDLLNTIAGLGIFRTDNLGKTTSTYPESTCPCTPDYNTTQYFGYFYSTIKLLPNLTTTTGLSYDRYRDNDTEGTNVSELNPKLGAIWKATDFLTFRAAGFKTVKSAIIDNQSLQPSQVAGFNQFYDDWNGTIAWQYGVGMDAQLSSHSYAGLEVFKRDLKKPFFTDFLKPREELYRAYVNWAPKPYLAGSLEFRYENYRGSDSGFDPKTVDTAYIPLELRFFESHGLFSALKGTYVAQNMHNDALENSQFASNFYLVDAAVGYRLPRQLGLISLEAKNLFDRRFAYRDRQFQMNEMRSPEFIPERMLFMRLTLNFF